MKLIKSVECQDADDNRGIISIEVIIEDSDKDEIVRQIQEYYNNNSTIPESISIFLDDEDGESHEVELDKDEISNYIESLMTLEDPNDKYSDSCRSEEYITELGNKFKKLYDKSIKFIEQIPVGTLIYGTFLDETIVTSEPFVDSNEIGAWVQVESTTDISKSIPKKYKYMVSLNTYGISMNGNHNLLFLNKEDAEEYSNTDWSIGTRPDLDYDGWGNIPIWISHPGRGTDRVMTSEEYNALPRRAWDCVTNDFTGKR